MSALLSRYETLEVEPVETPVNRIGFTIINRFEDVGLLGQCIRVTAMAALTVEAAHQLELAVVEALNNIIEHGFKPLDNSEIVLIYTVYPDRVRVMICDQGSPMPSQLLQEPSDVFDFDPENLDSLPEGGMGLALIRQSVSSYHYISDQSCNFLILVKLR